MVLVSQPAFASKTPRELRVLLPSTANVISVVEHELDGVLPREFLVTYRYQEGSETVESLAVYKRGCGLIFDSFANLATLVAPTFETRDLTQDSVLDVLLYQSVHAGQELLTDGYRVEGCRFSPLISEFSYPAVRPTLGKDSVGAFLQFVYESREACRDGVLEDDEGYVRKYRFDGVRFALVEEKPFRRLYPLFSTTMTGGSDAERLGKQLGATTVYDHLSIDLTGDKVPELVVFYAAEQRGELAVFEKKSSGYVKIFQSAFGVGPLVLDGQIRTIDAADLTGDGVAELLFDSNAEDGCQLDTWVLRFQKKGQELLLKQRRPLRERVQLRARELAYRIMHEGQEIVWRWNGSSFASSSGDAFGPVQLAPASSPASQPTSR